VLLVEDDQALLNLAEQMLGEYGYCVLLARDGEEALKVENEYSDAIHLLLTDVVMPGMDGRNLAEKMQSKRPDMKVLFMSGYTDNAIAHHGVLDTGLSFIQKPFTAPSLARKVREVLDQYHHD
ncbi:MAG: response regulator, partial [Deltaproteobacteria bacterium]|nr:response regulator [Deltaproteobacteria bacterium]